MKIVFLIDQVYRHGGIERVLSIKANYLASNSKNSVYIITSEQNKNKACYHFNSNIIFKDLGVNYHRNLSYFHPKNVLKIPRHIRLVKQTLNKIKPDVVVVCSHSVDTYFVPFINKSIPKVKEFHFSKSIEVPYRKKGAKSKKKYFLYFADYVEKKYNKLIVLNKDEAKVLNIGIKKQKFKASELSEALDGLTPRQRTHLIAKMKESGFIRPLKESGRTYYVSFMNNFLMRSLIQVLEKENFIPPINQ
ncbi:hypothetical protein [Seonamhaeicola sp.]|uniref:hypothetical protein n=1 Tax=Seonamhaeicola sp. TaxID=1912245 RepID=UPI00356946E7